MQTFQSINSIGTLDLVHDVLTRWLIPVASIVPSSSGGSRFLYRTMKELVSPATVGHQELSNGKRSSRLSLSKRISESFDRNTLRLQKCHTQMVTELLSPPNAAIFSCTHANPFLISRRARFVLPDPFYTSVFTDTLLRFQAYLYLNTIHVAPASFAVVGRCCDYRLSDLYGPLYDICEVVVR